MKLATDQLVLASRSPRRRLLLREAGIEPRIIDPDLDDGRIRTNPAVPPSHWVAALAYLKARAGAEQLHPDDLVLGADTVVVQAGRIMGQPRDRAHASDMIRSLRNAEHQVVTGVAMIQAGARLIFADTADVTVGEVSDQSIEAYLDTGAWRGKAGGYNLAERQQAGWPIHVNGDPTTVMGLPMNILRAILKLDEAQTLPA